MKKKILAGAITLLSVVTLAACSQAGGKDIITMKGNTITVSDFYNKVKNNAAAQQVLLNMTIQEVFEKSYGKHVTEKEVMKRSIRVRALTELLSNKYWQEQD